MGPPRPHKKMQIGSLQPATLSNTEYETRSYCNGEFAFVHVAAPAL